MELKNCTELRQQVRDLRSQLASATAAREKAEANAKALREALATCTTAKSKALWLGGQAFGIYQSHIKDGKYWNGISTEEQKAWIAVGSQIPDIALIKHYNTPEVIADHEGAIKGVWLDEATAAQPASDQDAESGVN